MRRYLLPKEGSLYKANLHTHSTVSDGKLSPEEVKEMYKSMGYHIVAYSDHEMLVEHSDLDDESFIALTAVEYAVCEKKVYNKARTLEFNLFARDQHNETHVCFSPNSVKPNQTWRLPDVKYVGETVKKEFSLEFIQRVIDEANANGFLVSLNHPISSFLTTDIIKKLDGLFAMEIYNHDSILCGVNERGITMYDELLRYGKPWGCIAADDFHGTLKKEYPAPGFVMIKAKELKYDAVIDALEKRNFYASTGPVIEELYIEDGVAYIKCSPVKFIQMETSYRPRGGIRSAHDGEYLTEASFRVPEGVSYIRFDLQDEKGNWAHTRGYSPDSDEIPSKPFFEDDCCII